jgi:hypothetical protein
MRIIVILFLLAACSCARQSYLTKPDMTPELFARDSSGCRQHGEEQSVFNDCMRAKGYGTDSIWRPLIKIR